MRVVVQHRSRYSWIESSALAITPGDGAHRVHGPGDPHVIDPRQLEAGAAMTRAEDWALPT